MLSREALIIFIKNPVLGKVKTRLAAKVGNEEALRLYNDLLSYTRKVTDNLSFEKFLFYSDHIDSDDEWDNKEYLKCRQAQTDDLGLRMRDAFKTVFDKGFQKAVIIGSDCIDVTVNIVQEAFVVLDHKDIVIGPARDGGYYLLGMKKLHSRLFMNKKWGTDTVFKDTLSDIKQLKLTYNKLPELSDIDEIEDLKYVKAQA